MIILVNRQILINKFLKEKQEKEQIIESLYHVNKIQINIYSCIMF